MSKDRIIWLDNLKGFLILIVVLGHTILFTNNDGTGNLAYRLISSFWMPLFMFTSGFSSYKVVQNWDIVKKRFFQLIIPFLSWSIILCAIDGTIHIEERILHPTQSMWFLWALFFIIVVHVGLCKLSKLLGKSEELIVILAAIFLWILQRLIHSSYFSTDLISYHFVFYCLGFYSRKYYTKIHKCHSAIIYLLAILFLIMAFFRHDRYFALMHLPHNCYILYEAICASLCLLPFLYFFDKYFYKQLIISKLGG